MSRLPAIAGKLLLELAWAGATVMASVWVAQASSGEASTDDFAFAGTLLDGAGQPSPGPDTLEFTFKSPSSSCTAQAAPVVPDPASGAFRAAVSLGNCAEQIFQGDRVTLDVRINGVEAATDQPVSALPYAKFADRAGFPDCPLGYEHRATAAELVCQRARDEVVKVGSGASAFWIDRYEASLWEERFGSGAQLIPTSGLAPVGFPRNGQYTRSYYAASVRSVEPARYVTWFQATAACRASGKRLPRPDEWLAAARGTLDSSDCAVQAPAVRQTAGAASCRSAWGAEDMIGNLAEWVTQWFVALPPVMPTQGSVWPAGYNADALHPGTASTRSGPNGFSNLPAAAVQGGDYRSGNNAGTFAFSLLDAPSSYLETIGFRCVVDR